MKKTLVIIVIGVSFLIYGYQRVKKSVYAYANEVSKEEKALIGCLKANVKLIESSLQSENDSILLYKISSNIEFIKNYQDNIKYFALCDKVFEIDSMLTRTKEFNSESKNLLIVNHCKKEISSYNKSLKAFFNSSIWVRNRLIRKGKIEDREYFDYSAFKSDANKPSKKREKLNAKLDSLLLEGLKKK